MVGDRLDTDVLFGANNGLMSILTLRCETVNTGKPRDALPLFDILKALAKAPPRLPANRPASPSTAHRLLLFFWGKPCLYPAASRPSRSFLARRTRSTPTFTWTASTTSSLPAG